MPLPASKKRSLNDATIRPKTQRPNKKQRKAAAYNSDSEDDKSSFKPVNLLDSDNEADLDAVVDDGADSGSDHGSQSDSASEDENSTRQRLQKPKASSIKARKQKKLAQDAPQPSDDDEELAEDNSDDAGNDSDADSFDIDGSDDGEDPSGQSFKSKRNDPTAFATSLQKILGTKLSTTRRVDPVLSRSADAHKASKEVIDAALEAKARKQMRAQKLAAQEKGRVKDVITGSRNDATGELEVSTAEIREKEKQLRRAATRGVKEVFNAFLRAQQAGMDAEVRARKDGFTGVEGRKEKVSEMSRKGFLDLIANGGGKLKKGGIEEA